MLLLCVLAGAPVLKESSAKTDFWGAWGGGTSSDESSGSASAWSFPWGASTGESVQDSTSESLIKVKSAEEIKSEVLKAAKERTKAKAKLFPSKTKVSSDQEKTLQEPLSTQTDKKTNVSVKLKSEKPPDTGGDKVSQDKEPKDGETDSSVSKETKLSEDLISTPQTSSESSESTQHTSSESSNRTQQTSSDRSESMQQTSSESIECMQQTSSEISVSMQQTHSESIDSIQQTSSDTTWSDIQEKETVAVLDQQELGGKFPALGTEEPKIQTDYFSEPELLTEVNTNANENKAGKQELHNVSEVMSVTEKTDKSDDLKEKASLSEESDKTEIVVQCFPLDDGGEVKDLSDSELTRKLSGTDISSSVEFVSEKDVPSAENLTGSVYFPELSGSDPEIIDCDKTNSDEELMNDKIVTSSLDEQSHIEENVHKQEVKELDLSVSDPSHETAKTLHVSSHDEDNNDVVFETDSSEKEGSQFEKGAKVEEHTYGTGEDSLLMVVPDSAIPETVKSLRSSDSESSVNKLDSSMETCTSEDTVVEQGSKLDDSIDRAGLAGKPQEVSVEQYENLDQEKILEEPDDACAKTVEKVNIKTNTEENETEKGTISPAHSFVKCMLEDAIEEGKHGDDNSDSHSSIEKSEGTRSVYSNQESGDEIDTTTSSDIEIISLPTPNGENRQVYMINCILSYILF